MVENLSSDYFSDFNIVDSIKNNIAILDRLYTLLTEKGINEPQVTTKTLKEDLKMFSLKSTILSIPPKVKSIYLIWILLNIFIWFAFGGSEYGSEHFFPFTTSDLEYYDIKEASFYIISPIIIFIAIKLWKSKSQN